jgi:hypothetical protein
MILRIKKNLTAVPNNCLTLSLVSYAFSRPDKRSIGLDFQAFPQKRDRVSVMHDRADLTGNHFGYFLKQFMAKRFAGHGLFSFRGSDGPG